MKFPQYSPVVFFRDFGLERVEERKICEKYFVTTSSRMHVSGGDIIVGRYSVLPFYIELEKDLKINGAKLINTFQQHRYIADMKNWASPSGEGIETLEPFTPKTWFRLEDIPDNIGPVVLKGETNSFKDKWQTHMFAKNKKEAIEVWKRLQDDRSLMDQSIYIREFVPYKKHFISPVNQQPITHEFRFFCYGEEILCGGFYWSNYVDELKETPKTSSVPVDFLKKIMKIVSQNTNFYVVDVAQCENGEFQVVELNDGQMSGLSECDPSELYKNLKYHLWDKEFSITKNGNRFPD